ncbi:MAG: helix-turn-helix domain-containing protein [Pseudomonadota bacterium]
MTRHDIGSHLGLSTETVSRAFSRFQREGLVRVWKQRVQLIDIAGLKRSAGGLA